MITSDLYDLTEAGIRATVKSMARGEDSVCLTPTSEEAG